MVELIRHGGQHTMVDLSFEDGSVLTATDGHPFWDVSTGLFTDAIDLQVGELVLALDGSSLQVTGVRVYGEDLTAYNLEIAGIHTYYAGATPVLVHNSCGADEWGLARTLDKHTAAGKDYVQGNGLWDEGVDLHSLAHMTDGLEGTLQSGAHNSRSFILDAGRPIGQSGGGNSTTFFQVIRDKFSDDLITMFPVWF